MACEFVDSDNSSYSSNLIITASSDLTCKLWTITGKIIGTFGQRAVWDIRNERTHVHFNPFETKIIEEEEEEVEVEEKKSALDILGAINALQRLTSRTDSIKSGRSITTSEVYNYKKSIKSFFLKYNYYFLSQVYQVIVC